MATRAIEWAQDAPREWFSARELADLALPGLPGDVRALNRRIEDERWTARTGSDGALLVRPRRGRGGGIEYHVSLLPGEARLALERRGITAPAPKAAEVDRGGWRWFDAQSAKVKAEAERRLDAVRQVELLHAAGATRSAAVSDVADQIGVSVATIWNWLGLVDGVPAADRLPALAPRRRGGGKAAEIDEQAWQALKSDFLRPEKPTFSSCYYRLLRNYAEPRGLTLPTEQTLRRRMERELDKRTVILRREGVEALRRSLPAQKRSVSAMHAMELVNIDGHRWDVFARWPDGTVARPMMVAIQDVYSRKMLAWSIGKTESAIETRLAFAHLFKRYGIPAGCLMDNGRAFASKWITGGAKSRFRFTIRDEEPLGILTALGVQIHWATPYRGQSKPIERGFRDLCDSIAKAPAFSGAYTGNRPDAKPENYGTAAIPIDQFIAEVEAGMAAHNARPGRRTEMGAGLKSLDQVFAESIALCPVGKATPEQLRLALLAADNRPTNRQNGSIEMFGNRYWSEDMILIAGDRVTVRFDPDDLHGPLYVYSLEGEYLCTAPLFEGAGFLDVEAARKRKRLEKDYKKAVQAKTDAEELLRADELHQLYATPIGDDNVPPPTVIRPVRHRGQVAAQLKPRTDPAASEAAEIATLDRQMLGLARLRAVK